jgi:hypothetical protein
MKIKRTILLVLGREGLNDLVDDLGIDGVDRRSTDDVRSVLSRCRRLVDSSSDASR